MAYDPAPGSRTDVPRPQPRAVLKVLPLGVVMALGIAVPFLAAFISMHGLDRASGLMRDLTARQGGNRT